MKSRILSLLKSAEDVVSGEALSASIGISRVSVWKHIQKLHEHGYVIEATPRGYKLLTCPDIPFSWEFPQREGLIHYFSEVPSTMDIAREMARKGAPHFTVVIAGRQTKGRGRLKRVWHSEDGGLYFTLILRPSIPLQWCYRINFAASLVLCRMLCQETGIEAQVKWPNDILAGGRKLSGMISEMEAEAEMVSFINVGVGINVNNDPEHNEPNAASLMKLLDRTVSRKDLLSHYLDELEIYLSMADFEKTIDEWKKFNCTLNKQVRVVSPTETLSGFAKDVDPGGALILELPDKSIKTILYGDCMI